MLQLLSEVNDSGKPQVAAGLQPSPSLDQPATDVLLIHPPFFPGGASCSWPRGRGMSDPYSLFHGLSPLLSRLHHGWLHPLVLRGWAAAARLRGHGQRVLQVFGPISQTNDLQLESVGPKHWFLKNPNCYGLSTNKITYLFLIFAWCLITNSQSMSINDFVQQDYQPSLWNVVKGF